MKKILCLILLMSFIFGNVYGAVDKPIAIAIENWLTAEGKFEGSDVRTAQTSDGYIITHWQVKGVGKPNDNELENIILEYSVVEKYTAQALILWAMETYPQLIGTVHEAALTAFANDPVNMKNLLIARGSILDSALGGTTYSDLANQIIAKAIELGADIDA